MTKNASTTGMPNSAMMTSSLPYAARFAGIRPTAMERRRGRLLRAPDHDAGTAAADPAPAPAAADPTPASPPAADPSAAAAQTAPAGDPAAPEGKTSLLGGALANKDGKTPPAEAAADPNAPAAPEHIVPEAYELSVDGMDLDKTAIDEATPAFKEAGLSNDQAQKLMPAAAKFRDTVANATLQSIVDAGAKQRADWRSATEADPDIGGAKLEETLHLSAKALDALGYPEGSDFRKVLTETGFGNHPEMARIMRRVGEMVSEDGFPRSDATSASQLSIEKRLYPND